MLKIDDDLQISKAIKDGAERRTANMNCVKSQIKFLLFHGLAEQ